MEEGIYAARQNLKNFAFRNGLRNCVTISTWGKVKHTPNMWETPTKLRTECYGTIAEAVEEDVTNLGNKRAGGNLTESNPPKKARLGSQTGNNGVAPASASASASTSALVPTRGRHPGRGHISGGQGAPAQQASSDGWIRGQGGRGGYRGGMRGRPWRGHRSNPGSN
jgi:hypothetical protein